MDISRKSNTGASIAFGVSAACAAIVFQTSTPAFADDQQKACSPSKNTICNVTNVEDLVAIDGTSWVVGSSLAGGTGKPEPLYLFDS